MDCQIHFRNSSEWYKGSFACAKGKAFLKDKLHSARSLATVLDGVTNFDSFSDVVHHLNGFFAIVRQQNNRVFLAVDRIRSMPLFYATDEGRLFISDDADWVQERCKISAFDPICEEEFLLTGFVIGCSTLYQEIRQVRPGEAVCFEYYDGTWRMSENKYYQFGHHDYYEAMEKELLDLYHQVVLSVFERVLEVIDGRQVVVPLSGGYDSRLVVLALRYLGYSNVTTFSYGRIENPQSAISSKVANAVGYPWRFIEYSKGKWHSWFRSDERKAFYRLAANLCALPFMQDWPAIWELRRHGDIPDDAVFIPGHSAGQLAGGRITENPEVCQDVFPTRDQFVLSVLRSHYMLWRWPLDVPGMVKRHSPHILDSISDLSSYPDWASAFDAFNVNEREAKFVVNIMRATEFWGYSWWLPYFDNAYLSFWERVPIPFRIGERLHVDYVNQLYRAVCGQEPPRPPRNIRYRKGGRHVVRVRHAFRRIWRGRAFRFLRRAYYNQHMRKVYRKEGMGWYGIVDEETYLRYLHRGATHINSILAAEYLGKLSFE